MSRGVKQIVSIAAAVAIPFAAPAIASSIGLSAAIGSATAASAITGAALGAVKGAALGEDIGRAALFGGIGGGISGYLQTPTGPAGGVSGGTGLTPPTTGATSGSQYALSGTGGTGLTLGGGDVGLSYGGQTAGTFGGIAAGTAGGYGLEGSFGGTPVDYSVAAASPTFTPTAPTDYGISGGTLTSTGTGAGLGATGIDYGLTASGGAGAGVVAAPKTFGEALSRVPAELKAKFSDPKALADLTLRAAGQLAGSALAGSGLTPEEQALLDAQTEELRQLQQSNQALFNQRLEQSQQLIGESRYFDPEYFGLQRARRAQVTGARAKAAGLRGLTGERRAAEARRFDLATGRDVGTAFDVGYGTGVQGRLQTQQAGLSAMPTAFPSSATEFGNLRAAYGTAAQRRRQTQQDIGSLFGSLTGRGASQGLG